MGTDREAGSAGRPLLGLGLLVAERIRGVPAGERVALVVGLAGDATVLAGRLVGRVTAPVVLAREGVVVTASRLPGAAAVTRPARRVLGRLSGVAAALRADGRAAIDAARADALRVLGSTVDDAAGYATADVIPPVVDALVPHLAQDVVPRLVDAVVPYLTEDAVPRVVDALVPHLIEDVVPRVVDALVPYLAEEVVPGIVDELVPYLRESVVPALVDTELTALVVDRAMPVIRAEVLPAVVAEMTVDPRVRDLILEQSRGVLGGATEQARVAAAAADERIEALARRLLHGRRGTPPPGSAGSAENAGSAEDAGDAADAGHAAAGGGGPPAGGGAAERPRPGAGP